MMFYRLILVSALLFSGLITSWAQTKHSPPVKNLKKSDRKQWLDILIWPKDCEEAFQRLYEGETYSGLEFYRAGTQKYLVRITCYRGAYQPGSIFAWYDAKKGLGSLLKFRGLETEDDDGKELPYSEISGFESWRAKPRILEIFQKYRGPGDCGFYGRYRILNGHTRLIEAREQECEVPHSRSSIDPRKWPRKKL